jgi:hypothetical protein
MRVCKGNNGWLWRGLAFAALLVLLGVVHSSPALAQAQESSLPDPGYAKQTRTDSQGRKITVVDFDEARIDGTVKAPEGFFLRSRSANKAENIMNLRKNFQQRVRTVGHEGLRAVPMN